VLVALMLDADRAVRKQLLEALSLIAAADFPRQWDTLLPDLGRQLDTPDLSRKARRERSLQPDPATPQPCSGC
jgi:hypothetical protein